MIGTTLQCIDELRILLRSNDGKVIDRIYKLNLSHPDEVWIEDLPEDNDGYICVEIPHAWFKILPPKKRDGLIN